MDIQTVLQQRNIPYITEGKNVKRGCVNVTCPWCGESDQGMHMGINPATGSFACWRNIMHRGPKIHALLMKLLGCSWEAAQALVTDTSDLQSIVARLVAKKTTETEPLEDVDTSGLRKLDSRCPLRFMRYLLGRDYKPEHLDFMGDLYNLQVGVGGRFNNRIVFPLIVNKKLVGHVGRCIDNGNLRYLSLPGKAVKQNILWYDLLKKKHGRRLTIVEGPFDALRIDFISRMEGLPDRATCFFGTSYTQPQVDCLLSVAKHYKELVILFDKDALGQAMRLSKSLLGKARVQTLPEGKKDPGDCSWYEILELVPKAVT